MVNEDKIRKIKNDRDKDLIIADLQLKLAQAQQQVNDMYMIIADIQLGGNQK